MRYEILDAPNGNVINVIEADADFCQANFPFFRMDIQPTAALTTFRSWPAFDFYRKFTTQERIAARALAKTDPNAEDFLHTLDAAIASGLNVRSDDPDTVAGLAYLSATPIQSPVLTSSRVAEILA